MSRIIEQKKEKVFVGLSGGVDSSVAAHLLIEQGYDVVGVFLRCYNIDGCAERDAEDARRVAEHLKIPFYVFDFEEEYKQRVVDYMIDGYKAGLTPNPDVMCNKEIKFGLFLERALKLGADYVATGHYVRLRRNDEFLNSNFETNSKFKIQNSELSLAIARDLNKDQSYFLWTLTQEQLKHSLFPLGDITKPEVRAIAKKVGLPTAEKKDSQGVCFLGMVDMKDFLTTFIKEERGDVRTVDEELVGYHKGVRFYTIGQRHFDIELLPIKGNTRKPFYIAKKDIKNNILYVAEGGEHEALTKKEVDLTGVVIDESFLKKEDEYAIEIPVMARVRYRQPLFDAVLSLSCHHSSVVGCKLQFNSPQRFVAEGQSAVFYKKDGTLIGGGVIL
ncbi:MAG: tRNA-specific 2-thiouridylase MnmA [Parcubacteria group bacterium LiPW_41]|nr:MAG: tRNA-specific 2-thiouridylase MnmA [Parcubacteria group bacterium LiPW_41]